MTGSGEKKEDLTIPEIGQHLDVVIGAQDEIWDNKYPALDLGGDGCVKTALHEKAFAAWLAAQRVAFGALTRLAAEKRSHHTPTVVTPLAVSAGGGLFPQDGDILPGGADRNTGDTGDNVKVTRRVEFDSSEVSDCA